MPTVAIDWDDTLVGYKKYEPEKEWLPGACAALRYFKKKGWHIVIHSCRASWPEGRDEIARKLSASGFRLGTKLRIHTEEGKPLAALYIDDRGLRFENDWELIVGQLLAGDLERAST